MRGKAHREKWKVETRRVFLLSPMKRRECVFADAKELDLHGGVRGGGGGSETTFSFRGWRFSSLHKNIVDSAESGRLQESITSRLNLDRAEGKDFVGEREESKGGEVDDGAPAAINSNINLRIPPMIFGHDVMKIEKPDGSEVASVFGENGFCMSLNAEDALTLWAAQHTNQHIGDLSIIQVPYAAIWARNPSPTTEVDSPGGARHSHEVNHSHTVNRRREGDDEVSSSLQTLSSSSSSSSAAFEPGSGATVQIDKRSPLWDWTFSSDYCCTLGNRPKPRQHILGIKKLFSPLASCPGDPLLSAVRSAPSSGIQYDLLRVNDVPILFYDEIILYQDDLEDCGEVVFEAKLRVMPHCWFLLSRMFLRVDGVLLRIRDNRFFHRFGTDQVHLEVTWKECKVALRVDQGEDERTRGKLDATGALFVDGSSMRDVNKLAQMVPVVSSHNYTLSC